ncbi:unnamed protein product [Periconia digitata]|uniref:Terpene synthase n=1 Tax=Periconia digitata TaxID=1303443 RepID=A0A9W4UPE0_9PLEO|nr:unnamed protein product [Periconia digitata]
MTQQGSSASTNSMNSQPTSPSSSSTFPCANDVELNQTISKEPAERNQLLAKLRGQTVRIPNLAPLFAHWPTKTNVHLNTIRTDTKSWIDEMSPAGNPTKPLQESDFGLFGATFWPAAQYYKLRTLTYFGIWLFIWDDQIDVNDGAMWNETAAAQTHREQTLAYVRYALGLDDDDAARPPISNPLILNFERVGAALKEAYTVEQNEAVLREMEVFMHMSEREQRMRVAGAIPSIEEFWRCRLGSSGIGLCLAFTEFSFEDMRLPASFFEREDAEVLRRCTITLVGATNDLLSLKKEIERDAIDSLVPLLYYHSGGGLQSAVDEVVAFLGREIKRFDLAADRLTKAYGAGDEDLRRQVGEYVEGCRYFTTGNLEWSMSTRRYGVETVDGEIVMKL